MVAKTREERGEWENAEKREDRKGREQAKERKSSDEIDELRGETRSVSAKGLGLGAKTMTGTRRRALLQRTT